MNRFQDPCVYRSINPIGRRCGIGPTYQCNVHGLCSYSTRSVPGIKSCVSCREYINQSMNDFVIAEDGRAITWAVGVTTAPRPTGDDRYESLARQRKNWRMRGPVIEWTLESLKNGGFDVDFVFAEPSSYKPDVVEWKQWIDRPSPLGAWRNWKESLRQLLEAKPEASVYMLVQDDVIVCKNSRQLLDRIIWPKNCGCLSLYCSAKYACGKGLFIVPANHAYWGACTLAFRRETAIAIVNEPQASSIFRADGNRIDSRIGHFCNRTRQRLYAFSPSLAQHIGERRSSIEHNGDGGGGLKASDFLGESFDAMSLLMDNKPKVKRGVAVVVPIFGCGDLAAESIGCLAKHNKPENIVVWFVDDGGPERDFKQAIAAAELSGIAWEVIKNPGNVGFTASVNAVIRAEPDKHILILNSDAFVQNDVPNLLLGHIEREHRVGVVGAMEYRIDTIGPHNDIRKRPSHAHWSARLPHDAEAVGREMALLTTQRPAFELHNPLSYFCVLLNREAINDAGMLDERLPSGLAADDEHCHRLARRGWKVGIGQDAFALHQGSASFKRAGLPKKEIQAEAIRQYRKIIEEVTT